jgi:hypothetical protein
MATISTKIFLPFFARFGSSIADNTAEMVVLYGEQLIVGGGIMALLAFMKGLNPQAIAGRSMTAIEGAAGQGGQIMEEMGAAVNQLIVFAGDNNELVAAVHRDVNLAEQGVVDAGRRLQVGAAAVDALEQAGDLGDMVTHTVQFLNGVFIQGHSDSDSDSGVKQGELSTTPAAGSGGQLETLPLPPTDAPAAGSGGQLETLPLPPTDAHAAGSGSTSTTLPHTDAPAAGSGGQLETLPLPPTDAPAVGSETPMDAEDEAPAAGAKRKRDAADDGTIGGKKNRKSQKKPRKKVTRSKRGKKAARKTKKQSRRKSRGKKHGKKH